MPGGGLPDEGRYGCAASVKVIPFNPLAPVKTTALLLPVKCVVLVVPFVTGSNFKGSHPLINDTFRVCP